MERFNIYDVEEQNDRFVVRLDIDKSQIEQLSNEIRCPVVKEDYIAIILGRDYSFKEAGFCSSLGYDRKLESFLKMEDLAYYIEKTKKEVK